MLHMLLTAKFLGLLRKKQYGTGWKAKTWWEVLRDFTAFFFVVNCSGERRRMACRLTSCFARVVRMACRLTSCFARVVFSGSLSAGKSVAIHCPCNDMTLCVRRGAYLDGAPCERKGRLNRRRLSVFFSFFCPIKLSARYKRHRI